MELFKLFGTILIDDKDALAKLKQTDDKGKKTAESLNKLVEQGVKIGSAIYAGAGVAVGGMLSLADSASTTARDIDKFSKVAGFSTDSYQKWDYVMKNLGYSMEQASGDMAALAEKALDASMGAGEGAELFGMLGVAVTDSSGKLKSQEQIFEQTITALQNMTDETKRNAIASALMGTTGEELTPILSMNSKELQNMKDKASELGIVMSGESIEAGKAFANNLNDVKSSFEAVKNNVARSFMPMLTNILNWVLEHMPEIQEVAGKAFDFISAAITFLTDNANILIPILGGLLGAFLALKIISVISGLMAVFNAVMLANPLTLVVLAIGAVVAGLIALAMNFDKAKAYALELWSNLSASFER
ncbi:MAG: phage tail tape measure protein, partial [Youngiibacter sp.]|nr:phage tail tape measure protein [Youngiibacter sp.]